MELKVTRYDIADGVATVWLHRPGRGNSWTNRMNAEYRWLMDTLDKDPRMRVVVVTGTGDQFCVGADAKALDFYTETDESYTYNVAGCLLVGRNIAAVIRPGFGCLGCTVLPSRALRSARRSIAGRV